MIPSPGVVRLLQADAAVGIGVVGLGDEQGGLRLDRLRAPRVFPGQRRVEHEHVDLGPVGAAGGARHHGGWGPRIDPSVESARGAGRLVDLLQHVAAVLGPDAVGARGWGPNDGRHDAADGDHGEPAGGLPLNPPGPAVRPRRPLDHGGDLGAVEEVEREPLLRLQARERGGVDRQGSAANHCGVGVGSNGNSRHQQCQHGGNDTFHNFLIHQMAVGTGGH
jgi:hypothetical protein